MEKKSPETNPNLYFFLFFFQFILSSDFHYHPKFVVFIRFHSWCSFLVFYGFGQKCTMTCIHCNSIGLAQIFISVFPLDVTKILYDTN